LGIVELAIGDLYKAQILFEDALSKTVSKSIPVSTKSRGIEVRRSVLKSLVGDYAMGCGDVDEYLDDPELLLNIRRAKDDAADTFIIALMQAECFQEAKEMAEQTASCCIDDSIHARFVVLAETAVVLREDRKAHHSQIGEDVTHSYLLPGRVLRREYPWTTKEHIVFVNPYP
jgi:hypothetical protein